MLSVLNSSKTASSLVALASHMRTPKFMRARRMCSSAARSFSSSDRSLRVNPFDGFGCEVLISQDASLGNGMRPGVASNRLGGQALDCHQGPSYLLTGRHAKQ